MEIKHVEVSIINVKNPKRVGTYRYMLNTVPIIEGEME